jgi:serine/threonine protein kinase
MNIFVSIDIVLVQYCAFRDDISNEVDLHVAKFALKRKIRCWPSEKHQIPSELHVQKLLRCQPHKNILSLLHAFDSPDFYIITFPTLQTFNGISFAKSAFDLYALIERYEEGEFPIHYARSIMEQMSDALEWLHYTLHIVHGDIKDENIIVRVNNDEVFASLIDFGSAAPLKDGVNSRISVTEYSGTMRQAAPEVSESFKVSHYVLEGIPATSERALTRRLNDEFSSRQIKNQEPSRSSLSRSRHLQSEASILRSAPIDSISGLKRSRHLQSEASVAQNPSLQNGPSVSRSHPLQSKATMLPSSQLQDGSFASRNQMFRNESPMFSKDAVSEHGNGILYSPASQDVWSLGLVLFVMVFGFEPVQDGIETDKDIHWRKKVLPKQQPEWIETCLDAMLVHDWRSRWTIKQAHDYLKRIEE